MLTVCMTVAGQTRKLQHRPYLDFRQFHYGFLFPSAKIIKITDIHH